MASEDNGVHLEEAREKVYGRDVCLDSSTSKEMLDLKDLA